MKSETFRLEIITPCFCAGADQKKAEIRAPSIRGQLRWWFRTLGGFKSLSNLSVKEQEALIFGSTAGNAGSAGKLLVRVTSAQPESRAVNAEDLGAGMNTPLGYALFPLRPYQDSDGRRGILDENTEFEVQILWRGSPKLWEPIRALIAVWGHLGCLGFRGRRAFGALQLKQPGYSLDEALAYFANGSGISVKALPGNQLTDWRNTAAALLKWYRSWRQHGQMNRRWIKRDNRWEPIPATQQQQNRSQPGFRYARRDHNEGLDVQGTGAPNPDPENPMGKQGTTFRPALGLPIIQFFSSLGESNRPLRRSAATVNWEWDFDNHDGNPKGRFASPVILRPHRDANGQWHALVIFVDAHRWPDGHQVQLVYRNHPQAREVSLELYNEMKNSLPDCTL